MLQKADVLANIIPIPEVFARETAHCIQRSRVFTVDLLCDSYARVYRPSTDDDVFFYSRSVLPQPIPLLTPGRTIVRLAALSGWRLCDLNRSANAVRVMNSLTHERLRQPSIVFVLSGINDEADFLAREGRIRVARDRLPDPAAFVGKLVEKLSFVRASYYPVMPQIVYVGGGLFDPACVSEKMIKWQLDIRRELRSFQVTSNIQENYLIHPAVAEAMIVNDRFDCIRRVTSDWIHWNASDASCFLFSFYMFLSRLFRCRQLQRVRHYLF